MENIGSFPSDIGSSISSLGTGPSIVTNDFQNVKVLFDNKYMFDNENIFPIDGESDKNEISQIQNMSLMVSTIHKVPTKILSFKTMIVIIITKNTRK